MTAIRRAVRDLGVPAIARPDGHGTEIVVLDDEEATRAATIDEVYDSLGYAASPPPAEKRRTESAAQAREETTLQCWETGPYKQKGERKVRRYGGWYVDGACIHNDRVVGAAPKHSKSWREVAKRDADAVVHAVEKMGIPQLRRVDVLIDRRGKPEYDRVQRADALCNYDDERGRVRRSQAAYCVSLVDRQGKTQVGLIYLPMGE